MQCLLRKDELLSQYTAKVCFHKKEITVVDGLTDTMQVASVRSDCWYYYPACPGSQLAVDAGIVPTARSAILAGSPGAAGSAVTTEPELQSFRDVAPGPNAYILKFPVLYLTPLLIGSEESLAERGEAYTFSSRIISSDRGDVYRGHMRGILVSLKHIGFDAIGFLKLPRTMRETFTLEKGHDADVCMPRILDVFTKSASGNYGLYMVFEVWGLPLDQFRALQGYGREDAQPSRHIRSIVEDTSRVCTTSTIRYVLYIRTSRSPPSLSRSAPAV